MDIMSALVGNGDEDSTGSSAALVDSQDSMLNIAASSLTGDVFFSSAW